jgi:hypothetical protein
MEPHTICMFELATLRQRKSDSGHYVFVVQGIKDIIVYGGAIIWERHQQHIVMVYDR